MTQIPGPARPATPPPPRNPAPVPRPVPPKPATPRPRLVDDVWFRIGVAAGAVGALLLVTHYFEPFLMLAALPVKKWRAAA